MLTSRSLFYITHICFSTNAYLWAKIYFMIEQALLIALATATLFNVPGYQRLTSPGRKVNPEYNNPYALGSNTWYEYRERVPEYIDAFRPFARKPFTCLFCMAFWFAVLFRFLLIPLAMGLPLFTWSHLVSGTLVVMAAPTIAVLVDRYVRSLPVKI